MVVENDLKALKKRIAKLDLSEEDKQSIETFDKQCDINGKRPATRVCYLKCLYYITKNLNMPFKDVTKDDLMTLFGSMKNDEGKMVGCRTLELSKTVTKLFFKFLNNGQYPECVTWIKSRKSRGGKLPEELLTEDDVKNMIRVCTTTRDKAFISMLYESGCRLGEIISLKLKHVSFDDYGAAIMVDGKTGQRRVRLVSSVPYIRDWINSHPSKDSPESFLWVIVRRNIENQNFGKHISYVWTQHCITTIAKLAGIKKRVHAHLFRHSRLTELARAGFNDAQLKIFAGWVGSSDMSQIYIHLSGQDLDNALLEINGIKISKKESILKPRDCARCGEINPSTFSICKRCWFPLDMQTVIELEEKRKLSDIMMDKLMTRQRIKEVMEEEIKEMMKEGGFTFLSHSDSLP